MSINLKTCEIMQYFEFMPDDMQDIQSIYDKAINISNVKRVSIIEHNMDTDNNGEPVERHFHMVLTFSNNKTVDSIAKDLSIKSNYVNKILTTTSKAEEYLIHLNDNTKYQYNPADVIANFNYVDFINKRKTKKENELKLKDVSSKIASGEIREFNLHNFISVDDFAKHKTYYKNCFEYRTRTITDSDRNLDCVFITGESGSGKTTYAKEFARKKGYSFYVSSGGANPFDDYKGQDCIILDDIRPSSFNLNDLLKITDRHTLSNVACRFYNKSLYECKLIIVTSVISIYDFYDFIVKEKNDTAKQLYRRFPLFIKMDLKQLDIYTYDLDTSKYEKQVSMPNIVVKKFKSDNISIATDFVNLFGLTECDINIEFD